MVQKEHLTTIGTETNATPDYALGKEHHCPAMSTLGGNGGRLEIERYNISGSIPLNIR